MYVQSVSQRLLLNPGYSNNFTCDLYKEWSEKLSARTGVNNFFNNQEKHTNDLVRKEQIVDLKKRQRKE